MEISHSVRRGSIRSPPVLLLLFHVQGSCIHYCLRVIPVTNKQVSTRDSQRSAKGRKKSGWTGKRICYEPRRQTMDNNSETWPCKCANEASGEHNSASLLLFKAVQTINNSLSYDLIAINGATLFRILFQDWFFSRYLLYLIFCVHVSWHERYATWIKGSAPVGG